MEQRPISFTVKNALKKLSILYEMGLANNTIEQT